MTITLWHNPRCGKSRQTLELLRAKGIEPTVREYLKQPPSKAEVETLIAERLKARQARNWAEADRLRDRLSALNVVVMDNPTGATWRMKD